MSPAVESFQTLCWTTVGIAGIVPMRRGWVLVSLIVLALVMGTTSSAVFASSDVWNIDSGPIDPGHYYGETIANGMIGITSTATPFRTRETLINGAYERLWPESVSSAVRSFSIIDLALSIDGVRIERFNQTRNFRQTLDMQHGQISTSFDIEDKASVTYTIQALQQMPHNALLDVMVIARRPIQFSVKTDMDVPSSQGYVAWRKDAVFSWLNGVRRSDTQVEMGEAHRRTIAVAAASAKGPSGLLSIAAAQSFIFDEPPDRSPRVTRDQGSLSFERALSANAPYHFSLVGATITSAHVSDPSNEAQRLIVAAVIQGTRGLLERHHSAWADLWQSDILIEGDPSTQRDVHSMLYHLYSFIREGTSYSISPMGLSGGSNDYLGHIFWDAETWMLPTLLAMRPELARSMLDYRFERLAAARRNAAMNGYRGAQFPWESAGSGDEDTWVEASTGPLEIHVSACVALAAWNYYRVTQDGQWLRAKGYPLIKETADFWTSRVIRNAPQHFDINHVVAADEYAENVDNDAYTNAAARANLAAAISAAKVLGLVPDPDWENVERNIPTLTYPNGVTREHATYAGEKIKQADVNLLAYPLQAVTDPVAVRRDLDFYVTRNDDTEGPAMTKSIFAILYQRTGAHDKAYRIFKSGYEPNKRPPFGVLTESETSQNPYFATGAGGVLQSLIYGFGGMDITDEGFAQRPTKLPAAWKSITLKGIGPRRRDYTVP